MSRKYPRIGNRMRTRRNNNRRGSIGGFAGLQRGTCDLCRAPIPRGKGCVVIEVQVGWFRGDDEVFLLCRQCGADGHTAGDLLASRVRALRERRSHDYAHS